jgi:hypothetical protein
MVIAVAAHSKAIAIADRSSAGVTTEIGQPSAKNGSAGGNSKCLNPLRLEAARSRCQTCKAGILIGRKLSVNWPLGRIRVFFHKVIIAVREASVKLRRQAFFNHTGGVPWSSVETFWNAINPRT